MNKLKAITPAKGVQIMGSGISVPEGILSNHDLEKLVETNDEWIVKRTGIHERHVVGDSGLRTKDLAAEAVKNALEDAGLVPQDLDLLILATMTPEMTCPATACRVVDMIGATPCGAFDLSAACTGFVAALNMAHNAVKFGQYRHVAVVGAETMSSVMDYKDRRTCILFGDAASAVILGPSDSDEQGCFYQKLYSDGGKWSELFVPRIESDLPESGGAEFNGNMNTLQMNGREVFKFAVTAFENAIEDAIKDCGLEVSDVDLVIPHQSNVRILKNARDRMGFKPEQMPINIQNYGNTSAASVGLALHETRKAGQCEAGSVVVFVGIGGGLTWGTSVWKI